MFGTLAIAGVLLFVAGPIWQQRAALIEYPDSLDHEEDYLLVHAWRLSRGEPYIQSLEHAPYIVATYNPIVPWIVGRLLDPTNPELKIGRKVAAISVLLATLVFGVIAWRVGGSIPDAILLALIWRLSRDALRWTPLFRVDFTALLFAWMALAVLPRTLEDKRAVGKLAISGLCVWLAFFCKQTAILPGVGVGLALLLIRPKWAMIWGASVAVAIGGAIALFEFATEESFWFHTVTANANTWSWTQFVVWCRHGWLFQAPLIVGAVFAVPLVAWVVWSKRKDEPRDILFLSVFVYAMLAVVSLIGAGKLGAADNYLLEPVAGLVLLQALTITAQPVMMQVPLAGLLLAFQVIWSVTTPMGLRGYDMPRVSLGVQPPTVDDIRVAKRMNALTAQDPKHTYCERASIALRHDAPLLVHPFITAQLAREGKWDDALLVQTLEQWKPTTLLLTEDVSARAAQHGDAQYTPATRAWIQASYEQTETIAAPLYTLFVWKRTTTP